MSISLFRSKNKFKADKQFAAGHGAIGFRASTNPAWTHMVCYRPLKTDGSLAESGTEPIPSEMVEGLKKKLQPYN